MFSELVSLYQTNRYLTSRLDDFTKAIAGTEKYLGTPGCNANLANAHLEQLRTRRRAALALLRVHRLKARRALA